MAITTVLILIAVALIAIIIILFFLFKKKNKIEKKVGLALGSGGSWGWAHIGVLKVLEENKIPIDYIAGSSMGAVIGSYYALNPDIKELQKKVFSLTKWRLIKLLDVNLPKDSLISGHKIRSTIEELVGDKSFSDTKIPLKIIATDMESGEEVVIQEGRLIDAIMASISIPGIFPPVRSGEKLLIDGGVIDPTPTNKVKEMGPDVVIGVDLTMRGRKEIKNPGMLQTIMRSYEILRSQSAKLNIKEDDKNTLIIKPDTKKLDSFKFYEIQKFIDEGERAAKESIPKIKELIFI